MWDSESGRELLTLSGHTGPLSQAIWSSDASRVLTASEDGTARVWDAAGGFELPIFTGHAVALAQQPSSFSQWWELPSLVAVSAFCKPSTSEDEDRERKAAIRSLLNVNR